MPKNPTSRKIRENIYGNVNGYIGGRKVREFGTDMDAANDWLNGIETPFISATLSDV